MTELRRAGLGVGCCLLLLAEAVLAQPAPSGRLGGSLGASVDYWYGPSGDAFVDQFWGRRATPDGVRLLETFELRRDLGYPTYDALLRFDLIAPLRKIGSLKLGLSPDASWVTRTPDARFVRITPSAGITLNADDWDFMVAPDEMTYRGLGVKLNGTYSISDVPAWLSEFRQRLQLDASTLWTLRFERTRLEVGLDADLVCFGDDRLAYDRHSLGGHVLLAGGARVVDAFVLPDYYATDGPGWEVLATTYRWSYNPSDTLWGSEDYLHLEVHARAQTRVRERFLVEPELTIHTDRENHMSYWAARLTPRVSVARLWTVAPGCLLVAQVGAALPIGFATHTSLYNGEIAVNARVGLSAAARGTGH
jgi:hypothetical protein